MLGFVVSDEQNTNDPQGKGPAANLTKFVGTHREPAEVYRSVDREKAGDEQTVGAVYHQHIAAGGQQPIEFWRQRTMRIAQSLYEAVDTLHICEPTAPICRPKR